MKVKINPQLVPVKESATLAINEKALTMRRQKKEIYHFGFGQSPFPVHPRIVKTLQDNSEQKRYLPTLGLPELRENIAKYYKARGYDWKPENIAIGPGSKELLFDLLYLISGTLLLPVPSWVSYYPQATIGKKQVLPIFTGLASGYKITTDGLLQAVNSAKAIATTEGPKDESQLCLILNSPNNPSGAAYSPDELKKLAKVAKEHNILIIADEIYGEVYFGDDNAPSMHSFLPENTVVTSGLSKSFSAGGYRLGFAAFPDALAEQLMPPLKALISETFSCVSTPIQYAACTAYSDNKEINAYVQQCNRVHQVMGSYIRGKLEEGNINCPKGDGSFYLFPDFNAHAEELIGRGINNSMELCNTLLQEAKVVLLPAQDFGLPPNYFACRLATVDYDGPKMMEAVKAGATDEELIALAPNITKGCSALNNWVAKLQKVA